MNKKGVSPLIGTVLLVAIVIAMILLIMPWVSNMIEKQKQRTTEASREFDCITKLNFVLQESGSERKIAVDNKGDIRIESITFRRYDTSGGVPAVSEWITPIEAYNVVETGVTCSSTVERYEAIAKIRSEGKDIVCSNTPKDYYC